MTDVLHTLVITGFSTSDIVCLVRGTAECQTEEVCKERRRVGE